MYPMFVNPNPAVSPLSTQNMLFGFIGTSCLLKLAVLLLPGRGCDLTSFPNLV